MDPRDPMYTVRWLLSLRDRARNGDMPPSRRARVEGYVDGYLAALLRAGQVTRAEIAVVQATAAFMARARRARRSESGELAVMDLDPDDVTELDADERDEASAQVASR